MAMNITKNIYKTHPWPEYNTRGLPVRHSRVVDTPIDAPACAATGAEFRHDQRNQNATPIAVT